MSVEKGSVPKPKEQENKESKKEHKFPAKEEFIKTLEDRGLLELSESYKKVCEIADEARKRGGRALLVGGSVRDMFFGKISKDFDLEVFGIEPDKLESMLSEFGKVSAVGKSFGITKVFPEGGVDIDVSIPRTDSKTGDGHADFEVSMDPRMSIKEAARRRDFTMNSMSADPLTGEIFDPFGGIEDIENKVLRITDREKFKEDPLRVLRAMQFMGRFGLRVDEDTIKTIKETFPNLKKLAKDRLCEEWKKLLMKADKPSLGLMAGMQWGVYDELHPEFPPLAETEQSPEWHPEGDAWMHTLLSVDEAAKLCKANGLEDKDYFTIMLATLCHDVGKPVTTKKEGGKIISPGHEEAGEKIAKKFLESLGVDNETKEKVLRLVATHMSPKQLFKQSFKDEISAGAIRRLAAKVFPASIKELVIVSTADHMGRGAAEGADMSDESTDIEEYEAGKWLLNYAEKVGVEKKRPESLIRGRTILTALGKDRPSKTENIMFGKLIRFSDRLRDLTEKLRMYDESQDALKEEDVAQVIEETKQMENSLQEAFNILRERAHETLNKIREAKEKKKETK